MLSGLSRCVDLDASSCVCSVLCCVCTVSACVACCVWCVMSLVGR